MLLLDNNLKGEIPYPWRTWQHATTLRYSSMWTARGAAPDKISRTFPPNPSLTWEEERKIDWWDMLIEIISFQCRKGKRIQKLPPYWKQFCHRAELPQNVCAPSPCYVICCISFNMQSQRRKHHETVAYHTCRSINLSSRWTMILNHLRISSFLTLKDSKEN